MTLKIGVIGGGVAGLTCAYAATRSGSAEVVLLESSSRLGGKILSDEAGGVILEGGPDSFITAKPEALELVRELGLSDELLPTNKENKDVYVYTRGRLRKLPDGLMLMAPTKVLPFLASDLLPWSAKLRMGMEIFIPAAEPGKEESLGEFTRRRFGEEALAAVIGPIMAGIYAGDPDKLSLASTFPQFIALERKFGSLIRGMRALQRPPGGNGALTMFVTLRGGLGRLIDELAGRLPEGTLRRGARVEAVTARTEGGYVVRCADGSKTPVDRLIVCAPANAAAKFLRSLDDKLAEELSSISYTSTATVSLVYPAEGFPVVLDGFGFVVDRRELTSLMAATYSSTKFPGRVPPEKVLIRCFLGGAGREGVLSGSDEALIRSTRDDLQNILGLDIEPSEARAYRWIDANPQYNVGHADLLGRIAERVRCFPGLALAGSSYKGVGIPDCVRSARAAAASMVKSDPPGPESGVY